MTAVSDFVHLHTHTEYSFLDGAIKIDKLVKKAVEFGMPAVAITDHGGLFGAVEFYETCLANNIKPILGLEVYVAPKTLSDKSSTIYGRKYTHLILLARNNEGWKNLMALSSIGYLEGFYYKPRVDMDSLRKHSAGLIATSACVAGAIPRAILSGDRDGAKKITTEFVEMFGEGNFYFELQDHGIDDEKKAFAEMIDLGKEMGIPFIVANDAHYLNKEDAVSHDVLLCMQTGKQLDDPNRFRFTGSEIYFKSQEEMSKLFPDIPEAMSNTWEIAQRCDVNVHSDPQLPVPEIPSEHKNADDYLRYLAQKGMEELYSDVTEEIQKRLDYELDIIITMGFTGYFLIVRDFVIEADVQGVFRGCRGSAAGSLVAFSIGITNVDPIKFDLIFERFLNPERVSLPDADIDFADNDRHKIIDYVVKKYGRDAVCQIINFGRMKAKMVVKDIARVMGISVSESNALTAMVTEDKVESSLEKNSELSEAVKNNPQYQELFKHARVLEGLARQPGMHAGGVIIAPAKVVNWAPLFKQQGKQNGGEENVMTQFDMNYVEHVGLIKMDFLGLRTLSVLQESLRLIEKYHGVKLDLWRLPDDDKETFELFHRGDTTNIFQFESQGMQENLRKLKPTCIEDLIAMAALYRPGPMDNIGSFIDRKHGKEEIVYPHPMLKDVLDVTYGIIVYQEQVMRIAQKMGGFTLGQADVLRKAMGKKKADKMAEMGKKFIAGAVAQNIDKKTAQEVFDLMAKFAKYGFNKAHATVYAHVSYQAAYLKTHYRTEYMTAVLTSIIGDKDKFLTARNEATRMGIKILQPDVNLSDSNCSIDNGCIRIGMKAIANVSNASKAIVEGRKDGKKYESIFDLCRTADLRSINKKALESLIYAGAMDSFGVRGQLLASVDIAVEYGNRIQKDRRAGQTDLFSLGTGSGEVEVEIPEPQLVDAPALPYNELLEREKDVLNFYVSGHPLDNYADEIRGFSSLSLSRSNIENMKSDTSVTVGGIIKMFRGHQDKKGRKMAFMSLEDFEGSIELIAFADAYEQFQHLLALDSMVLIRGDFKKKFDGSAQITVEKVMALSESRDKLAKSVHVRLETSSLNEDFINKLYDDCSALSGNCNFIIHIITQDNSEFKFYSQNLTVGADKKSISFLRDKLGQENVWISKARK